MEENLKLVGHDVISFMPYPDDSSEFHLMVKINFYEAPLLSDSIIVISSLVGLYNSVIDKSELFSHSFDNKLILKRDGLSYLDYFNQNYENKEIVDKILKSLGAVFNSNSKEISLEIMSAAQKIINE